LDVARRASACRQHGLSSTGHWGRFADSFKRRSNHISLAPDGSLLSPHPDPLYAPLSDISGWEAWCLCGWPSPLTRRARGSSDPFGAAFLPQLHLAWLAHAHHAIAVRSISECADAVRIANVNLDVSVRNARSLTVGLPTWEEISQASGLKSRQLAHTRWHRRPDRP
jgi:hypothetical protein